MTPILWRRGQAGDAAALSVLGGATFLAAFAHDHPGRALIDHIRAAHGEDYYRAVLADPAQTVIIGETPLGAPVAYAVISPPDLPVPVDPLADIELKRIYLLSGWQGGGHGDALMEQVADVARAAGRKRLLLAVYTANDRARRFYARHGFAEIGETIFMVGDTPFRDLVYARPL